LICFNRENIPEKTDEYGKDDPFFMDGAKLPARPAWMPEKR
jgi:hypothetical protein